jgi:predicted AAA+ superfamily ATPase
MDYIHRHITDNVTVRMKDEQILALTGARQTGKTTLCEQEIPAATNLPFTYITFDDPDERLRFQKAAVSILESLDTPLVILDEVQKLPSLFDPLKLVADRDKKKKGLFRRIFLLTGSSQFLLMRNVRETLAGRIALFNLHPLSLSEMMGGESTSLLDRIWKKQKIGEHDRKDFFSLRPDVFRKMITLRDRHLTWGGYPPVWQRQDETAKANWLKDYRKTYLERDIADVGQVADIDLFAQAQKILCARTANILSVSEVARDLSLSVNTVKRYIGLLTLSFQCNLLPPYYANVGKRLVKSPKIFFPDTGLIRTILGNLSISSGAHYESWLFSELNKWRQLQPVAPELFFYRTGGGREIDFLLVGEGRILPIEAKSHDQVTGSDGRNMECFLKEYESMASTGLVVYPGRDFVEIRKNIWAIPDWYLFARNPETPGGENYD